MSVAYICICCDSLSQQSQLLSYLDEETTPDFVDDLPEEQQGLFELIEACPFPDTLEKEQGFNIIMYYEYDAFEAKESIPLLLSKMDCNKAIFLNDHHDETHYYRLSDDYFKFYYSPEPMENPEDDKEFNQNLSSEQKTKAQQAYNEGKLSLLRYLAQNLET